MTTQLFVSFKGGKMPDTATLSPMQDGPETSFVGTDTAKFSPFTGESVSKISAATKQVEKADLASLVTIGTCACGETHLADLASVHGMFAGECTGFYCMSCAAEVPLDVNGKELYLAQQASDMETGDIEDDYADMDGDAETDETDGDDCATMTAAEFQDHVNKYADKARKRLVAAGVIEDDAPLGDETESEDSEMRGLADEFTLDSEEDGEGDGENEESEVEDEGDPAEAEPEPAPEPEPDTEVSEPEMSTEPKEDESEVNNDETDGAGLFKKKEQNPEAVPVAEVVANPITDDETTSDSATLVKLDANVDFASAAVTCVIDPTRTRYYVFANNAIIGVMDKASANPDTAAAFETPAYVRGFVNQKRSGKPVSQFGYKPFTVKVDVAGITEKKLEAAKAAARTDAAAAFDGKVADIRKSLAVAAVAANKGVWKDFANPVKDELIAKLKRIGFGDAASVVTTVFAEQSSAYIESILGKAMELASKTPEARDVIATMVDTAAYQVASPEPVNKVAEKLTRIGTPDVAAVQIVDSRPATVEKKSYDWAASFARRQF